MRLTSWSKLQVMMAFAVVALQTIYFGWDTSTESSTSLLNVNFTLDTATVVGYATLACAAILVTLSVGTRWLLAGLAVLSALYGLAISSQMTHTTLVLWLLLAAYALVLMLIGEYIGIAASLIIGLIVVFVVELVCLPISVLDWANGRLRGGRIHPEISTEAAAEGLDRYR